MDYVYAVEETTQYKPLAFYRTLEAARRERDKRLASVEWKGKSTPGDHGPFVVGVYPLED